MNLDPKILQEIEALHFKKVCPATIGHILRDKYNISIPKLCKSIPFLSEKSSLKLLEAKISRIREHLKKNKQDIPTKRALLKLQSKLYNSRRYYEQN